jgi:phosphatidate cytidylyltransferase
MLKARILTALVLLLLFVPALLSPSRVPWLVLTLVLMVLAAWEWGRAIQLDAQAIEPHESHESHESQAPASPRHDCLPSSSVQRKPSQRLSFGLAALTALVGAGMGVTLGFEALPAWVSALLGLLWVYFFSFLFDRGAMRWSRVPLWLKAVAGWCVLLGTWWSIAVAQAVGSAFLLSVLCLVWVADIAAYFGGKAWGRHKLAPQLSPGKTWEGVVSGLVGVYLLAYGWLYAADPQNLPNDNLFALLWRHGAFTTVLGLAVLVMVSVMGDLFESMVKRSAGLKDSSQLLPGHGGVLDRVDALLPTLPMAVTLLVWLH